MAGPVSIHLISCESASGNEGATVFQASSSAGLPKSARVYTKLMAWFSDPCCLKGLLVLVETVNVDSAGGDRSGVDSQP